VLLDVASTLVPSKLAGMSLSRNRPRAATHGVGPASECAGMTSARTVQQKSRAREAPGSRLPRRSRTDPRCHRTSDLSVGRDGPADGSRCERTQARQAPSLPSIGGEEHQNDRHFRSSSSSRHGIFTGPGFELLRQYEVTTSPFALQTFMYSSLFSEMILKPRR
jgi:hypothetical protein